MKSLRWRVRRKRRMRERALPVTTNRSQAGDGAALLLVMTSTWSPWLRRVRSGTRRPLTLAPMQLSPTSEWTA